MLKGLEDRAEKHVKDHLFVVSDVQKLKEAVTEGVSAVHWCGSRDCADRLEEISDASILGTEVRTDIIDHSPGRCLICNKPDSLVTLVGRSY